MLPLQLVAQQISNTDLALSGAESLDRCHWGGGKHRVGMLSTLLELANYLEGHNKDVKKRLRTLKRQILISEN